MIKSSEQAELEQLRIKQAQLKNLANTLSAMHNDLIVTMQTVLIEWKHGRGAEAALQWVVNTLAGPGLLPNFDGPYGKEAQAYMDKNRSDPLPECFCGRPSNIAWMSQGFCSDAHYKQVRDQQQEPA